MSVLAVWHPPELSEEFIHSLDDTNATSEHSVIASQHVPLKLLHYVCGPIARWPYLGQPKQVNFWTRINVGASCVAPTGTI